MTEHVKPQAFTADVAKLLHLMVHSIYSDKDVFLRELISNAADACEKLRYEAVQNPALTGAEAFAIRVETDPRANSITITDNGIGMSDEDLVTALGTIARSGTKSFLDSLKGDNIEGEEATQGAEVTTKKPDLDLIGQFGIGFYSAFMVAKTVVVETRRAGSDRAFRWTSDGQGTYEIAPLALKDAPKHGTRVILHLSDEAKDFANSYRLRSIIQHHSSAITVPVDLLEKGEEADRISQGIALWARPKSEISAEDYTEFYQSLSGQFDEPALTLHWRAEGRYEYNVLAFVPSPSRLICLSLSAKARANSMCGGC